MSVAQIAIAVVAVEHLLFLVLEMFLWTTPFGRKTFGLTPEFARESAKLAANQGLYNGFLAAGLAWSLLVWNAVAAAEGREIATFFLACVVVAGLYGGVTVKRSVLVVQGLPAIIALGLLYLLP